MKTENLTFLEAIEAMKRGECVESSLGSHVLHIRNGRIECYFNNKWESDYGLNPTGFWDIVPDPSKPRIRYSDGLWRQLSESISDAFPTKTEALNWEIRFRALADYIAARIEEKENERN